MLQDRKPRMHSAVAWSGTYDPGTCWGHYNDELRTPQNRGCVQAALRTVSGLAFQLGVNRALLLCSGPSAIGRLKDTFFLGERSNFKLTIVHRSKEVRAPGRGKGSIQSIHPPAHQEDGEKCSRLPDQHPAWGPLKWGQLSLTGARSHCHP